MPVHESDICIIGGGITSVMLARKLANLRPGTTITIVEAGRSIFDFEKRLAYRSRIGRQMCRTLELTTRRPAPMA